MGEGEFRIFLCCHPGLPFIDAFKTNGFLLPPINPSLSNQVQELFSMKILLAVNHWYH